MLLVSDARRTLFREEQKAREKLAAKWKVWELDCFIFAVGLKLFHFEERVGLCIPPWRREI